MNLRTSPDWIRTSSGSATSRIRGGSESSRRRPTRRSGRRESPVPRSRRGRSRPDVESRSARTIHLQFNQGDRITFAAAVVEVEVNKDNGVVTVKHVYGAMDCGLAINPGIVESQIVGMAVHGASVALKEEVHVSQTNVTSLDWNSYQTLRFGEHPAVTPIVVQRINEKSSGAGEEVLPAVVAAIGNAFFDATGVRQRQYPLTPTRVLAALKSAASVRA